MTDDNESLPSGGVAERGREEGDVDCWVEQFFRDFLSLAVELEEGETCKDPERMSKGGSAQRFT